MPNVWYIGASNERRIFNQVFRQSNGWAIDHTAFTPQQLVQLEADDSFLLNQDGLRTSPAPPPGGEDPHDPAFIYYEEVKRLYDLFVASYDPDAEITIPDNSIVPAKLRALSTTPSASLWYRGDGNWAAPPNTTYSALTLSEAQAGTASTARAVNALLLKQILYWYLTGDAAVAPGAFGQQMAKAANQAAARSALGTDLVDNTSDANKPVSTAQAAAIALKVDKLTGLTSRVITIDAAGAYTSLPYSAAGFSGNTVAVRDANGQILVATTPTNVNHAVSKSYADLKAPIASPTFTGTVGGVTKAMVGLGNVDNTTDAGKPVSTAQQSALDLKANITDLAGYAPLVGGKIPASYMPSIALNDYLGAVSTEAAMLALTGQRGDWVIRTDQNNTEWRLIGESPNLLNNWIQINPAGTGGGGGAVSSVAGRTGAVTLTSADLTDGTTVGRGIFKAADAAAAKAFLAMVKSDVGLGSVDNTADSAKPVSTAQAAAIALKANAASPVFTGTPTGLIKDHVGLPNVDNTSDANKPVSTAQAAAIALKVAIATAGEGTNRVYVRNSSNAETTVQFTTAGSASTMMYRDANGRAKVAAPSAIDDIARLDTVTSAVAAAQLTTVNAQTAAYTLALADANKAVEITSATAVSVTVPPSSTIAFPIGTTIDIAQCGAGAVTLAPGAGVTLRTPASLVSRAQWSTLSIRKRATDEWIVTGDMV